MIRFTLKGEVMPKKNIRGITKDGRYYTPAKVKQWVEEWGWQIRQQQIPKLAGKMNLEVAFYIRRDKDIDNCLGGLFDCLQDNGVIANDRDIISVSAIKRKSKEPRVEVQIEFLEDEK
jgi:Holliday junction resolvase RusA-like endonuclease